MSRGPGRTQRTVLEFLEGAGGSLPVGKLYRDLALRGVDRSNARRAIKGLLERGDLVEAEEDGFQGRRVRCIRAVVSQEASLTDLVNLWWESYGERKHRRQCREEQEGATATPWLGGESLASSVSGEAEVKRQHEGTPQVPLDTPSTVGPRNEESVSDNVLRLLQNSMGRGSPHESDAGGATGRLSDNAVRPGASIPEILADPEARAFIASPAPMVQKPNEDEEGGR